MSSYAVCTECDFLRVRSRGGTAKPFPHDCPQCGAALVVVDEDLRFQPAYVSRIAFALHGTEALAGDEAPLTGTERQTE